MVLETKDAIYQNYINGVWQDSMSGETLKSINPANRHDVVGYIQASTAADLDKAVSAAEVAKVGWRKIGSVARGEFLYKAAAIMEERVDDIAKTMTREMGKTLPESIGETKRAIAILRYYAGDGMRSDGDVIPSTDPDALMYSKRVPLGVVGIITPWNFPAAIPIWKSAPALIYGNTVVLKPASEAAVTTTKIMSCLVDAGFPKGVVNVVNGRGSVVGERLIHHPDVHGITFTGSNYTGKRIAEAAAARGIKYQLEMGGKNPVIVDDDVDLDLAVQATISGGLRSAGQKCTCTSRVIVHEKIYEAFKEKLVTEIEKLRVGNGLETETWMGPSVSEKQLNTVLGYIEKAKEEGGTLLVGGKSLTEGAYKDGFFVEPTVFDNVNSQSTIGQEEIFGPVLAMIKVASFEEAIKIANDVDYGLSASIFTKNISKALAFIDEMDAGLVRVNAETAGVELQAPFGGMKQSSSHSREQGQAAKDFFTSTKTIFIKG